MKKMLYALSILGFVFFTSCSRNRLPKVPGGVQIISKCCNGLLNNTSSGKSITITRQESNEEAEAADNIHPLFPEYTLDTKMMIW